MTLVLGIDPGITKENPTGIVIVNCDRMTISYAATCTPRASDWQGRVRLVTRHIRGLLARVNVDLIAYEQPPLMGNAQTLIKLASLTGAMLALADEYNLPCVGVSPAEAKVALACDSRADKPDMIASVRHVFGKDVNKDVADAVGVALAGETIYRLRQLVLEAV